MEELVKLLKVTKYKIDTMTLEIEDYGEFEVEPIYIGSMILEKDYENYNFPFFEITLSVPNKVYRAMRKKNITITAYIRMKYVDVKMDDPVSEQQSGGKNLPENTFMAKTFYVYGIEGSPTFTEEADEALEKFIGLDDKEGTDLNNATTIDLLLYDVDIMNRIKGMVNEVITDCTLTDAVTRVLNYGGFKNVLMSPATNGRSYHEFTLLPMRHEEQLERICNDYGIYSEGARIFYDFECTYILRRCLKCTAWRPGEYKRTYVIYNPQTIISGGEDAAMRTEGTYEDGEEECNYCTMADVTLSSPNQYKDQVYGTSYLSIDTKTGNIQNVTSDSVTANDSGSTVSRVVMTNRGNTGTTSEMVESINNENTMWEVLIDNMKIDYLDPNKEFVLFFNDKKLSKYNGQYAIKKFMTTFHKSDGEWFTTSTLATFAGKKIQ